MYRSSSWIGVVFGSGIDVLTPAGIEPAALSGFANATDAAALVDHAIIVVERVAADHGAAQGEFIQRNPVPLHRWHFITLSPFFTKPLPSQFLHLAFFFMLGPFSLAIAFSNLGSPHDCGSGCAFNRNCAITPAKPDNPPTS
jgi:hypothetical protein